MSTSCGTSPVGVEAGESGEPGVSVSWDSHSSRVGERCSSAHDSRCRIVGTWAFQQATEQNTNELPLRLHVLTLHVPLSASTRHMIGPRELSLMRRTAYLVNTARGPVVDEAALAAALREGTIAGAALDVYDREPIVHPELLPLENAVLAPHLGSATMETRMAMAMLAARNVVEVLQGRPPLTPIG